MDVPKVALRRERQFALGPIRQDEEQQIEAKFVKVLQEYRLSQPLKKSGATAEEVSVRLVGRDQVEVEIGVRVGSAPGVGASQERSDHPLVCPARRDESLHDGTMPLRKP